MNIVIILFIGLCPNLFLPSCEIKTLRKPGSKNWARGVGARTGWGQGARTGWGLGVRTGCGGWEQELGGGLGARTGHGGWGQELGAGGWEQEARLNLIARLRTTLLVMFTT